jgi:hypothetical protein
MVSVGMLNHTDTKAALVHALEVLKRAYLHVSANAAGMSSGELYARLSAEENWQDMNTYERMLALMVRSNMVKVSNHWVTALSLES